MMVCQHICFPLNKSHQSKRLCKEDLTEVHELMINIYLQRYYYGSIGVNQRGSSNPVRDMQPNPSKTNSLFTTSRFMSNNQLVPRRTLLPPARLNLPPPLPTWLILNQIQGLHIMYFLCKSCVFFYFLR